VYLPARTVYMCNYKLGRHWKEERKGRERGVDGSKARFRLEPMRCVFGASTCNGMKGWGISRCLLCSTVRSRHVL
jgi:hypothetical protein